MSDQFKEGTGATPESAENQKYAAFQEAKAEEERIMAEITQVLDSTPDRAEAEKIVVVKYAPMMDEAMRESKRCLNEWLETIKVDGGEELE